ncbi:MAG: phosphoribosylglycinamide formyltransferase [Oligoflexia bacterium]|nr:phosphoribosylglycinamide formyltransferase [Oligoflexia bacterium]
MRKKIAVLISGTGTNLRSILEHIYLPQGLLNDLCEVVVVIGDRPEASPGLQIARSFNINYRSIERKLLKSKRQFEEEIIETINYFTAGKGVDYIVLAGFMSILSAEFVQKYCGKIINIHPADTKDYQGPAGYEWAYRNKLQETKITVHLVDEGVDSGPILAQQSVDLRGINNLEELKARGKSVEHLLYPKVLAQILTEES